MIADRTAMLGSLNVKIHTAWRRLRR